MICYPLIDLPSHLWWSATHSLIYQSIHPPAHQFIHQPIHSSTSPFIHLPAHPPIHPPTWWGTEWGPRSSPWRRTALRIRTSWGGWWGRKVVSTGTTPLSLGTRTCTGSIACRRKKKVPVTDIWRLSTSIHPLIHRFIQSLVHLSI